MSEIVTVEPSVSPRQAYRRIARLERRYNWLIERIAERGGAERSGKTGRDLAESSALRWIIDEYIRLSGHQCSRDAQPTQEEFIPASCGYLPVDGWPDDYARDGHRDSCGNCLDIESQRNAISERDSVMTATRRGRMHADVR